MSQTISPTIIERPTTIRLYISPLEPSLLRSILPASILPQAVSTSSYHGIETFPEKSYGYIEVPAEEGEKLKKKLNGSILRGMKVRVEEARQDKKRKAGQDSSDVTSTSTNNHDDSKKRSKRSKYEDGVLNAVELPSERQVKRGWAPSAANEKQKQLKKTKTGTATQEPDRSQMIFRASLPPSATSASPDIALSTAKKVEKKTKKGRNMIEVKEFAKTTKQPTFLKDSVLSTRTPQTTSFVEGIGWVDEAGTVVQSMSGCKNKKPQNPKIHVAEDRLLPTPLPTSQGSYTEESASSKADARASTSPSVTSESARSNSDASSTSPKISNVETTKEPQPEVIESSVVEVPDLQPNGTKSSGSTTGATVHPLEALFKRPAPMVEPSDTSKSSTPGRKQSLRPVPAPIVTSFSFFESDLQDGDEAEEVDHREDLTGLPVPPVTPFTRRDLEQRGQRSAAPTPDTAAVGKRLQIPWKEQSADVEEDESDGEQTEEGSHDLTSQEPLAERATSDAKEQEIEQTEFEKHFWAHRGDYNRSWKARKREARKEARQALNRRVGQTK